ncbi:MAG: peptidoglycan-binding protein [Acidobacteria bacterium]|nr:peptidoglycan-binding protein [Acidobacteriota bacterium]
MPNHTVVQGETISSIAETYGFSKWETIWNHGNNAALREVRPNPHVLLPGDVVFVPDKVEKSEDAPTAKYNVFKVKLAKLKLNLQFQDINAKPIAGAAVTIAVEGAAAPPPTTDGDGKTQSVIKRSSRNGTFVLTGVAEAQLLIGSLDPVEEISGQTARLNNLGYEAGDTTDPKDEKFRSAVEEFQCDNKIKVTGTCDATTRTKLVTVHGC